MTRSSRSDLSEKRERSDREKERGGGTDPCPLSVKKKERSNSLFYLKRKGKAEGSRPGEEKYWLFGKKGWGSRQPNGGGAFPRERVSFTSLNLNIFPVACTSWGEIPGTGREGKKIGDTSVKCGGGKPDRTPFRAFTCSEKLLFPG